MARAWPRLQGWLEDDTDGHRILRHLTGAADAWRGMGAPDSELYRGVRLAAALEWQDRSAPDLTPTEREFLAASSRLEMREHLTAEQQVRREHRVNRRLRALLIGVLALLLVAALAGWGAVRQAQRADLATRESDSRLAGARGLLSEQPDLAVLLALAGMRIDDSPATRRPAGHADSGAAVDRRGSWDRWTVLGPGDESGWQHDGGVRRTQRSLALRHPHAAREGQVRRRRRQAPDRVLARDGPLDFSPDGRQLAVGKFNLDPDSVVLLDSKTLEPMPDQAGGLPSRPSLVNDIKFSADGSRMAAAFIEHNRGSNDWVASTVLVWDTADLSQPVNRIRLDAAGLVNLSFGKDRVGSGCTASATVVPA